ncbi:MAG: hemolysin family protein [Caldisericaceae bacterium]
MDSVSISFIILLILLLISALVTTLESAMFNANLHKLQSLAKKNKIFNRLIEHKKNPESFISVIVITNNFVNFLFAGLVTRIAIQYATLTNSSTDLFLLIGTLVSTIVVVIFGETVPKNIGSIIPEKILQFLFPIFIIPYYLLKPVAFILTKIVQLILKVLGIEKKDRKYFESEEELMSMIETVQKEGFIEKDEEKMILSIFEFGDTLVEEVMTPRVDVVAIDIESSLDEILDTITKSGYSRYPVYEEKIDNIIGILYLKDIMKLLVKKQQIDIRKILRPPYFVPETKRLDELFKEMQKNKMHLAIVFDEFGGFAGIVTIEDILEEIVGEIQDELEAEEKPIQKIGENAYLVSGSLPISDFNEIFSTQLSDEQASTISGLILETLGRLPNPGEEITIDKIRFIISKVGNRRIIQIKAIFKEKKEGE